MPSLWKIWLSSKTHHMKNKICSLLVSTQHISAQWNMQTCSCRVLTISIHNIHDGWNRTPGYLMTSRISTHFAAGEVVDITAGMQQTVTCWPCTHISPWTIKINTKPESLAFWKTSFPYPGATLPLFLQGHINSQCQQLNLHLCHGLNSLYLEWSPHL